MADVETESMKNYQIAAEKIDPNSSRYPYCIVWTPIPVLSWLFPFIGHMGICTSTGVIRDFAGPYFVSEDNMAFGRPTKYWMLDVSKVYTSGSNAWDTAVHDASEEYKHRMLCWLSEDLAAVSDPDRCGGLSGSVREPAVTQQEWMVTGGADPHILTEIQVSMRWDSNDCLLDLLDGG
ncbi:transmembrane protein 222 isoform X2 [Colossoma macropomum]|uniref:transmembrane protein 222 isoform X2 n=1 Tax=Colossoma macropomum TaxID=42526 RepID=UPI001863F161|nr:transmembrane protein 222 isoform X2 [Colossoma macropomum]